MPGDQVEPSISEKPQLKGEGSKLVEQSSLTDSESTGLVQNMRGGNSSPHLLQLELVGGDKPGEQASDLQRLAAEQAEKRLSGKDGERVRETTDAKYFVTGPDGVEREYAASDRFIQQPGKPTRWPLDGGAIDNESDKPVLVLGKGVGHPGNEHGDGYLRMIPPHTKTDGSETDYDGIVTDKRFQPVVLPDGKVLMPTKVDPDAEWTKVPDRNTGVISKDNNVTVDKPILPPKGEGGVYKMSEYTGGRPLTPETPEIRRRDENAQAAEDHKKYEEDVRRSRLPDPGKI